MRIAIIDDVLAEQDIIIKYVKEWAKEKKEIVEILRFQSSESFLFSWEEDKSYHLLILDIEMGKMNGLEFAKRVRCEDKTIPIMFITGYDEYMQYGYDVSALHYLLKPVNKERLFQVLSRLKTVVQDEIKCLILSGTDEVKRIQINELMYVEAAGHGSVLNMQDQIVPVRESLGTIEKLVEDTSEFVKSHRGFIVNLRYVSAIQNTDIILDNGARIPISRKQMKSVQQAFLKYYKR